MHPSGGAVPQEVEALLGEFLVLLEAVQRELDERWRAQEKTDCHLDRV
ncbi:hypothetical protein OG350_14295 [Streptomyces achromogenes]|uniref:Uncharacterized protein n=1 Tax=Streptomyces achromogenes TaxID=67255 RepID=A0ABZ1KLG6_STRAH